MFILKNTNNKRQNKYKKRLKRKDIYHDLVAHCMNEKKMFLIKSSFYF